MDAFVQSFLKIIKDSSDIRGDHLNFYKQHPKTKLFREEMIQAIYSGTSFNEGLMLALNVFDPEDFIFFLKRWVSQANIHGIRYLIDLFEKQSNNISDEAFVCVIEHLIKTHPFGEYSSDECSHEFIKFLDKYHKKTSLLNLTNQLSQQQLVQMDKIFASNKDFINKSYGIADDPEFLKLALALKRLGTENCLRYVEKNAHYKLN